MQETVQTIFRINSSTRVASIVPRYTSNMLKGIRKQVRLPWLGEEVFQRMKALGILKPFRGGVQNKNKQDGITKKINTVI